MQYLRSLHSNRALSVSVSVLAAESLLRGCALRRKPPASVRETGTKPPDFVLVIWQGHLHFHHTRDAAGSQQELHENHYSFLDPDEARFITPEIIRAFCRAGQAVEIAEQLRALESQGLSAIAFITRQDLTYRVYEDFARKVIAKM